VSVAWFDGVTITVEVAFTTAPLASSPSWTDVSAYVRGIEVDRGRSDEFSKFGPGTCSVTFSNRDRRFDPEYAAGAYFGNLNPMKKIRVRATYSATTYDLFVGFVQGWPQDYVFTFDSTVTVRCVDASRILDSSPLAGSAYEAVLLTDSPIAYWPFRGQSRTDLVASISMAEEGTWGAGAAVAPMAADNDSIAASAFSPAVLAPIEGAAARLKADVDMSSAPRTIEAWVYIDNDALTAAYYGPEFNARNGANDYCRFYVSSGLFQARFSNTSLNRNQNSFIRFQWSTGWHHLAVVAGNTVYLYVDGVEVGSAASAVGLSADTLDPFWTGTALTGYVPQAAAFAHASVYATELSAARIAAHYQTGLSAFGHPTGERTGARVGRVLDEIGWPAADRTLSTGDTVHGPYIPDRQSAMGYMQDAETAEDGLLFIGRDGNVILRDRNWQWTRTSSGTFSDDGSDIPYESITIDANSLEPLRTAVSVTYGTSDAYIKVEDATAKAAYGPALESLSTPTLQSSLTARSLAQYRLRAWKDPATRITELTVQPRAKAATAYPVVLGLELGDRITVERTPGNPVVGSQIVKSLTVQGISHSIDVDGTWLTTLYLSPAPALGTAVPYLIVGDATYGQIGAGPGNKIPF
jgi:hypothetical protein